MSEHIYDLIIVGAGPAGLTAGLYAGRATLDTLILEQCWRSSNDHIRCL